MKAAFLLSFGVFIASTLGCSSETNQTLEAGTIPNDWRIQPYATNPWYWQYKGEPVMLLGGSREDNLFQIGDLEAHLNVLTASGGNYIRNTMSSRDEGDPWPFFMLSDSTYDLDRLNEPYFERFEKLLRFAYERDIIVQIELWDRFDFSREPWLLNPYRPANNINYTTDQTGLENEYPRHPGRNDNPFFRSIPAHENNKQLLGYQHMQVDRMIEISLPYPNVLYCMDNETSATPEWGLYWSGYIKEKASEMGVDVQTTEMWDAWDLRDDQHRHTLDRPDTYGFVDISQNNHNTNQLHWDNLQWVRRHVSTRPRPLNHVKIYGADTGHYGTDRDGLERFWRSLIGGAASIRFHRPTSGMGLNAVVRTHLKSARLLLDAIDIFTAVPDTASSKLLDRDDDEAYLCAIAGEVYAVYFPDEGSVRLDLSEVTGSFLVDWLEIGTSTWRQTTPAVQGPSLDLNAPGPGHWIALIRRP